MRYAVFTRIATSCAALVFGAILIAPSPAQQMPSADPNLKFTANKHLKQGLDCTACHGDGPKKPVTGDKCLECHESFDNVAKRTQDMEPNPHDNHQSMQGISCTECHKGHKTDVVFCQQCHGDMKLTRNSAKK
jgi:fumarate reductase flavoprotein subunit